MADNICGTDVHRLARKEQGLSWSKVRAQDFSLGSLYLFDFDLVSACCIGKYRLNGLSEKNGSW